MEAPAPSAQDVREDVEAESQGTPEGSEASVDTAVSFTDADCEAFLDRITKSTNGPVNWSDVDGVIPGLESSDCVGAQLANDPPVIYIVYPESSVSSLQDSMRSAGFSQGGVNPHPRAEEGFGGWSSDSFSGLLSIDDVNAPKGRVVLMIWPMAS